MYRLESTEKTLHIALQSHLQIFKKEKEKKKKKKNKGKTTEWLQAEWTLAPVRAFGSLGFGILKLQQTYDTIYARGYGHSDSDSDPFDSDSCHELNVPGMLAYRWDFIIV